MMQRGLVGTDDGSEPTRNGFLGDGLAAAEVGAAAL
jgi:hypothetical protein